MSNGNGNGISVLIVEDDPSLLRLLSVLLQTEGFEVQTTADGSEALSALSGVRPDAVILDLSMSVMDGRSFYRLAREGGYDGPMMICSAFGAKAAQRELGAEASIEKPFNPDMLVATLRKLL